MNKNNKRKLEDAWYRAFNSMNYNIVGIEDLDEKLKQEIQSKVQDIDKTEWWPVAENLLGLKPHIDEHQLADDATTIFINNHFNTTSVKVYFKGGY